MEVRCGKCGNLCEVEIDHDKAGGWPSVWCDTCDDDAEGVDLMDLHADIISSKVDAAHDAEQNRRMMEQ